jgi:cysteinyl-tRNA synthetase
MHPKVTENIDLIIDIINKLVEKGFAYVSDGDVYFETEKFKEYGKLSHMPLEELKEGASERVEDTGGKKRSPVDFALWKAAKDDEHYWESPFGNGRPGWHIECSAMSGNYIGDTIDIHSGGADLIFPHHENEIAQSEAATGKPLANYWMHNGMLNIDNRKMSKSLNNFFLLREAAEEYGYEPVRFMLLGAHYRSPMNYNAELIESYKTSLERLYNCRESIDLAIDNAGEAGGANENDEVFVTRLNQFKEALDDDLNTADAIAAMFDLTRDINSGISEMSKETLIKAAAAFDEMSGVLGLLYNKKEKGGIPEEIKELAKARAEARSLKNFKLADEIRDKILSLGYKIEETRQGIKITVID